MKNKSSKKMAKIFFGIFLLFAVCFTLLGTFINNGTLPKATLSQTLQSVLVCLFFLPIILALFFFGQRLKEKSGKYQIVSQIAIFASVALLIFGILQIILSALGAY